MLFNSLHFLLFFIFVTTLYYTISWKHRWILLLCASCYFYASFIPAYLLIIGVVIVIDYFAGIWIEESEGETRLAILILSLISNIGFLVFFKYFDFLSSNISNVLALFDKQNPIPKLKEIFPLAILPIGLSFHTFQSMSYTIEVFRRNQKAERHFGIYSLYVLFYPQLVAGPIERPQNVLWQFRKKFDYDWDNIKVGLSSIAWGMFKKVVIADRLALVTDSAYGDVSNQSGSSLIIATFFYCFQIYCDFSGYSDIALGTARVMGFKLMTNFNAPYFAESISEFWKRWHISLSTWFRDYVYIPLGGNRVSKPRVYRNLMIIFLLSGLWHGADWKFIIWGGMHGTYLILAQIFKTNNLFRSQRQSFLTYKAVSFFHVAWTFLLVAFAWIFFRATSVDHALEIIKRILSVSAFEMPNLAINLGEFIFSIFLIVLLLLRDKYYQGLVLGNKTFYVSFSLTCIICYLFGVFTSNQFIYFQF